MASPRKSRIEAHDPLFPYLYRHKAIRWFLTKGIHYNSLLSAGRLPFAPRRKTGS